MNELRNLQRCEHPNRIINPYTHEVMYVPCRTCNSCLNQRSNHWKKRVNDECTKYRYVMFFTLTYSNDNLPLFLPFSNDDGTVDWYSNRDGSKFNENDKLQDSDIHPIRVQNSNVIGIPYVSKYDIVCFVKRFRSHIHYYFKKYNIQENEKIRYFICSEYGPRTLRPHYHGLFFFDSETICREFSTFIRKAWSYGNQDYSLVNSSAPRMWRNTLMAILVCLKFYSLNIRSRSTSQVKTLVSDIARMMRKKYLKTSLLELTDIINSTKIPNNFILLHLPVMLKIDTSRNVEDLALYLILKNYEYTLMRTTLQKTNK